MKQKERDLKKRILHIQMHIYTNTYIYKYIHIQIHIYTNTYIQYICIYNTHVYKVLLFAELKVQQ